jgi:hypothetical protein
MGDEYIYFLVEKFNEIFAGEKLPDDWRIGRIAVLPKEGVDNSKLENRRPLTITSIIYRIFMQVFKGRLQDEMEKENKIGPWQCGFRKGFRIEDNLFVLTQVREMAAKLGKNLVAGFIDIKKAYDMVDREKLFDIMIGEGIQDAWVELMKDIYTDNEIFIKIGEQESDRFRIDRGLRQGCPASPVCFLMYYERVARKVWESGMGFEIEYIDRNTGNITKMRIPFLLFADDMIILAGSNRELEEMMRLCEAETKKLGLRFNAKKSAVMVMSGEEERDIDIEFDGERVEYTDKYRYLGVTIMDNTKEMLVEEKVIRKRKADRGVSIVRSKSLWSFNRYVVTRDLWKALFATALSYGNAVLVFGQEFENILEARQRMVARYAMGCRYMCANEFVEGESGMSTFKEREATSKIKYLIRLKEGDKEKLWAAKLQEIKGWMKIKTKWDWRVDFMLRTAGWAYVIWDDDNIQDKKNRIKKQVKERSTKKWQEDMRGKNSLAIYRESKLERQPENGLYDNSVGSRLLADARAGMLDTMECRAKYMDVSDICRLCGVEREDVEHVVLKCEKLGLRENNLKMVMGLGEEKDWEEIGRTKNRLGKWKKMVDEMEEWE